MAGLKLLIDTNVFIALEDEKEVAPDFANLVQLCNKHAVEIFVHEAALDDINRDSNAARRKVSLSKVKKFGALKGMKQPSVANREARFGPMPKANDIVDVALLCALEIDVVDFLVTQDHGIHNRAKRAPSLADRVLRVADAVAWLRATFEPKDVNLPFIEERPAHGIPTSDDIFDSLREGYAGFDEWWTKKCVPAHRKCWVATIGGEIAGLVVRKDETHAEAKTKGPGPKILKVCTFKVKLKFQGEKLGELLLKQVLWFAQKNGYDLVYVTSFDNQKLLISALIYFGFEMTGMNALGEQVYEKPLSRERLVAKPGDNLFELARRNYPRFVGRSPADAFYVPIKGQYHDVLFPELAGPFPDGSAPGASGSGQVARKPGNTIRKVYICNARTKKLVPGSVMLLYRSSSATHPASQSVTSIGVVEAVTYATSLEDLVKLTAKRSVYTRIQLERLNASKSKPIKVIDFLLIGHIDPVMKLAELKKKKVVSGHPPQSIAHRTHEQYAPVRQRMDFGFKV